MKNPARHFFPVLIGVTLLTACQRQPTEEEKYKAFKAEMEHKEAEVSDALLKAEIYGEMAKMFEIAERLAPYLTNAADRVFIVDTYIASANQHPANRPLKQRLQKVLESQAGLNAELERRQRK